MTGNLIERLQRYSEQCIAERLDADFARAIQQAIQELVVQKDCIDILRRSKAEKHNAWLALKEQLKTAKNELCLHCGRYKKEHLGACDGCRWREEAEDESNIS